MDYKQYKFSDVKWDTEGEDVDLPTEGYVVCRDDEDEDDVVELLTEKHGWCILSLDLELLD